MQSVNPKSVARGNKARPKKTSSFLVLVRCFWLMWEYCLPDERPHAEGGSQRMERNDFVTRHAEESWLNRQDTWTIKRPVEKVRVMLQCLTRKGTKESPNDDIHNNTLNFINDNENSGQCFFHLKRPERFIYESPHYNWGRATLNLPAWVSLFYHVINWWKNGLLFPGSCKFKSARFKLPLSH